MEIKEKWAQIVGYEGIYDISDVANVRRMKPEADTFVGKILKTRPFFEYFGIKSRRKQ